ncbi:unnamed protein product, partial [Polarella glacialis]
VWKDAHVVNLMSAGLVHPDVKIAAALAHLFLGNKTKGLEGILDESEDEEEADDADEAIRGIVGAKKTANRVKRAKRVKKAALKTAKKGKKGENTAVSFVAIDLLHDAQTLADRVLQRLSKGGEPFLFRLLMLHLIARLVGRHQLQLLNLYPFLLKYLVPTQSEVTKVLAALVEASHPQVPPDEVRPVILHIVKYFVTEAQAPEVIEVGLNAIREVCARSINILTEEELGDLVNFRKFKNKGVSMAARSLINTYRELHPQILHRSLRGREAAMALSRGEVKAPEYGEVQVSDRIEGLEMLVAKGLKKAGGTKAPTKGPEAVAYREAQKLEAQSMMTDQVLSADDFRQLRKLRLQKSIETQLGRKRKAEEVESDSEEGSGSSTDGEGFDEEKGLSGRLPDQMSGDLLRARKVKGRSKADRLKTVEAGRTDFKQKVLDRAKDRKGGKTNKEHARNKPLIMTLKSETMKKKSSRSAKQKLTCLRGHIKTLRLQAADQAERLKAEAERARSEAHELRQEVRAVAIRTQEVQDSSAALELQLAHDRSEASAAWAEFEGPLQEKASSLKGARKAARELEQERAAQHQEELALY